MFLHTKELIQPVSVGKPDARFGTFLLEQFGGATGELRRRCNTGFSRSTSKTLASATCCRTSRWKNSAISKWSAS